jgi:hypothetical protein
VTLDTRPLTSSQLHPRLQQRRCRHSTELQLDSHMGGRTPVGQESDSRHPRGIGHLHRRLRKRSLCVASRSRFMLKDVQVCATFLPRLRRFSALRSGIATKWSKFCRPVDSGSLDWVGALKMALSWPSRLSLPSLAYTVVARLYSTLPSTLTLHREVRVPRHRGLPCARKPRTVFLSSSAPNSSRFAAAHIVDRRD